MHFDWHRYVDISPQFGQVERKLITAAFDGIANAHDGEGAELIRKAAVGGKKILVEPDDTTHGTMIHSRFSLSVNMEQIARMGFGEGRTMGPLSGNGARHPSLTGVIVHELYHGADTLSGKAALQAQTEPTMLALLKKSGVMHAQKTWRRFLSMYEGMDATYPYSLATDAYGNRESTIAAFRTHGYADVATMLDKIDPFALQEALKRTGVLGADGVPRWERDAVAFTDAFMWKNFGDAEPQRRDYLNVMMLDKEGLPRALKVDRLAHVSPGYVAEALPELQRLLPRIRKVEIPSHP